MNSTISSQGIDNTQESTFSSTDKALNRIEGVIEHILASGQITRRDQNYLEQALLSGYLPTRAEHNKIREIYFRLQKGLLKVVD